jgi:N-acetylneuraminic acid mutarotase
LIAFGALCLSGTPALAARLQAGSAPLGWTSLAPLPTARGGLASTIADGQVFVIGGAATLENQSLNTVEAYDPGTDTWHTVNSAGLTPRGDFGVATAGGRIYAIGGYDDSTGNVLDSVESFDPRDPAAGWRSEAPLPIVSPSGWQGDGGLAAAAYNGLIYVAGGYDQDNDLLSNLEIYNPRSNTWSAGAPMPTPRGLLRVTVADGRLYAVGGLDATGTVVFDTVEAYNPTDNRWSSEAPIPIPRAEPAMATLADGNIVAAGGCCEFDSAGHVVGVFSDAELYSPRTNTWNKLPPLPDARASLTGAVIDGNQFLAIGGFHPGPTGVPEAQSSVFALRIDGWSEG